jgi:hypothetical protein
LSEVQIKPNPKKTSNVEIQKVTEGEKVSVRDHAGVES